MHKIFVLSRNRPLYLWACLDSLYRLTRSDVQITFIDSASDDPMVRSVVAGFERRGMFDAVIWLSRNDAMLVRQMIASLLTPADEIFGFIESDAVLQPGPFDCWFGHMLEIMQADPKLAMLGSLVDADDFVELELARRIAPELSEYEIRDLTHHEDPERQRHRPERESLLVFSPHNPSGRLLLMRQEAILKAGHSSDSDLNDKLRSLGLTTGISTKVRHRHLSLLNIFDYPKYDMKARNGYMRGLSYKAQAEQRRAQQNFVTTKDPDIHLVTSAGRIDGVRERDGYSFQLEEGITDIWLTSRVGFAFGTRDQRPLGIALNSLTIDGEDMLKSSALSAGWYHPEEQWRWMSGRAELPPARRIELRVTATIEYELEEPEKAPAGAS